MTELTERDVLDALATVIDRERCQDVVTLGMVKGLRIQDGHVMFALEVEASRGPRLEPLRKEAEEVVHKLKGVVTARAMLTAERPASTGGPAAPRRSAGAPQRQAPMHGELLPEVKAIVAVASGKGGVGKSTTAVNLAVALARQGHRTGLLDADVYGPSMRRLLGIAGNPGSSDGVRLDAMERFGIKAMSMAFLVEEETPIVWRGPMVQSALEQMMRDVAWGALDVLVVDMPPGTGDTQLTMAQRVPLAGAVIVSTPQDIALIDARKGLNMFRKVDVPVLGIIENMSYFICPHCQGRTDIFGHGGAEEEAQRLGVDFLGGIPLDVAIRETSDGGTPIVVADPDGEHAKAYLGIASRVWERVEAVIAGRAASAPRIVIQ
ncbi:MAG: iron-sulfur cluster carrier protein ApbC [Rhodospirillales bacterium]|nr:MAG: iron-sulfur cluster carrier protein ApbC [Rhodospirillales bacterium]